MPKKVMTKSSARRGRGGQLLGPKSPRKVAAKSSLPIENWYPGEAAKRGFGTLCQRVNGKGTQIGLLGSEEQPLLVLEDTDSVTTSKDEVEISIDEAKANWSAVTAAALFFGTVFRISGKKATRAVLHRHKINRHLAIIRYQRQSEEKFLKTAESLLNDLRDVCEHFDKTTALIESRFREVWRENKGLPPISTVT